MKLYHYTSYSKFRAIWKSQKLLFSDCRKLNDMIEVEKLKSAKTFGIYDELYRKLFEYRQISLTQDFCDCKKGFMSPMLWAHYGDKARGICIELDFSKLNIPKQVNHAPVAYLDKVPIITYEGDSSAGIDEFISSNISNIFFSKLNDWQAENEYRIICKEQSIDGISIKGAVTAIYISSLFHKLGSRSRKCKQMEKFVDDPELVREFFYTQRNTMLKPTSCGTKRDREVALKNCKN